MTTMTKPEARHFNLSSLALATADELERRGAVKATLALIHPFNEETGVFETVSIEDCKVCALGGMSAAYVGDPQLAYDLLRGDVLDVDAEFFRHFVATFNAEVTGNPGERLATGVYDWFDARVGGEDAVTAEDAIAALREFAKAPAGLNPTPQTADEALAIIRAAVRERGPQFNYRRHFQIGTFHGAPVCEYTHNGEPGCIVGLGLHLAGQDAASLPAGSAFTVGERLGFGMTAMEVLRAAQVAQDLGDDWGLALEKAERRAAELKTEVAA